MTLTEFMHPLKGQGRKQQVQAVLAYYKRYEGVEQLSVGMIRSALVQSRMTGAKSANITQALTRSVPNVHQVGRNRWAITETGERYLRDTFGVVAAEPVPNGEDVATLAGIADGIADDATRGYVEEAVLCLKVRARRAAVVFLWSGAVSGLRAAMWTHGAPAIETALVKHNPKARFAKKADFEGVKDSLLLQAAHDLGLLDQSQKKRLGEALDLRNDCGHPVKYNPGEKKVASFIEDVVGVVWR